MDKVNDTVLFGLVHDYLKIYLPSQRNCSKHTIRSYRKALDMLLDFVKTEKAVKLYEVTFKMIDRKILSSFLDSLEENGCGISTRNLRLTCIRSFYNYAAQIEPTAVIHRTEILRVPLKNIEKVDLINYISENAVKTLLEQPDALTRKGVRDQMLMLLMYDTAARVSEVVGMRVCDIKFGKTPTVKSCCGGGFSRKRGGRQRVRGVLPN